MMGLKLNSTDRFFLATGIRLVSNPMATRLEVRRVPGGYMNHWLIRAEVRVPCTISIPSQGIMYAHPSIIEKLRACA